MDGFININKAAGLTSFAVVKQLRRLLPGSKLGHLGTLDPMATGVLPIAIGNATRVIEYLEEQGKVYKTCMTLGGVSDTQDAWGNITYSNCTDYNLGSLPEILKKYTGVINQIPPMFSAVHYHGERLYDLARRGIVVDREARSVTIDYIKLLSIHPADSQNLPVVELEVACAKGTYIRTLCHDIGQDLGCGAYLSALVRTRVGKFTIDDSWTVDDLRENPAGIKNKVQGVDFPLDHMEKIVVTPETAAGIENGVGFALGPGHESGFMRVYDQRSRLIAIGTVRNYDTGPFLQPVKVFKSTINV